MTDPARSIKKRLGLFNKLILIANIVIVLALSLSYLSVHVSPVRCWFLPFFGLLYPELVIINLFFILYWILRKRWLFLISAIIIIAGWNHVQRSFRIGSSDKLPDNSDYFKIISYNVKNLSNDNVDLVDPEIRNKIINYLADQDADIICLQEFAAVSSDHDEFVQYVADRLNMPFNTHFQYFEKQKKNLNAILTFSKFPILDSGPVKWDSLNNYAAFADILVGNDTIRLFNVHLESLRLKHEDYIFISDLDQPMQENENIKAGSKRIIKKLKTAFLRRASQADALAGYISDSAYPVILCGDFNDTPNSYTYQKLTRNMEDAFMESGTGFGNTYIGKLPSNRIDFILYSDSFTSGEYRCDHVKYSDHFPVSCMIGVRQKE